MNIIRETVKSFLQKYDLDKPDLVYLVAFSGGYDSMCLLHALRKSCKNKIIALHLNHNWRGEESDAEEKNCKDFCNSIGIEFYSEKLSSSVPHTETAARNARYEFFDKCAKNFDSKIIFTAHNKNDNAETLIYRISMGTGISGLQGISEQRDMYYRPLLTIEREEIEKYCTQNKLNPNNDSSNSDTKYKRNFIRKNIMPALNEINPESLEKISTLSDVAKEETEIVEEYLKIITEKISDKNQINTKKFLNQSQSVQKRLIYNLFNKYNLEYDRKKILNILEFIHENSTSKSGKTCSLSNNLWIFTSDKIIEITDKQTQNSTYFHITKEGKYENEDYVLLIEKFDKEVRDH